VAQKFSKPKERNQQPEFNRFGGLKPFEHHHVPDTVKDHFQYAGHQNDRQDQPPSHNNGGFPDYMNFDGLGGDPPSMKDPLKWDPPTPKIQKGNSANVAARKPYN
jgi:hypothetical protein